MPPPSTGALIRSWNVVLTISSSKTPGLSTWPARANRRVPVDRPPPSAANAAPPLSMIHGQVRHGLDVVDHGRVAVEADGRRKERRLDPGEAPLALEGLEQRRLLAADVGTGPGVDDHVDGEPRAEDVPAHGPVGVGIVECGLDPFEPQGELAPDEDEHLGDLQRVGGDDHTLDELVGVAFDEQVVLEGGRLRLVAVDHEVGDRVLAQHRPLAAGREPGAAASEQAGRVDLGGHLLGGLGQRGPQALVAARWPGSAQGCASRRSPAGRSRSSAGR